MQLKQTPKLHHFLTLSISHSKRTMHAKTETGNSIPVIDLQDFPRQSSKLIESCEEWGCFRLINHDEILPPSLIQEMKAVVRSLLDLPTEIKMRNIDVIDGSGYMAPSKINPLYEALGLYDFSSSEAVDTFCDQLDASPAQSVIIHKYAQAMHQLMKDIGHKLSEGLNVPDVSIGTWPCLFRINKYSFVEDSIGSYGVQIHTDSGFLTILQDDDTVGGLEVMDKSGTFIAVDPWPGTLIVNLGDIATAWSNGRLHNVKHRVLCKEAATRVSIASFAFGPKYDKIEPPSQLVDSQHPLLYKPFTYEENRKLRQSTKLHAGEALDLLRITT